MNAKQRRAHTRELTALYKGAVPSEFNAELVSELIDAGKDIKHKENVIEALRAEIEALKQQVEQGKRDAVPEDIRKDAESWRFYKKRKDEVIAAGMGRKILRDAAAPKQEK